MRIRYLSIVTMLFVCVAAAADIYKYVDENGNVVFTDEPTENAASEIVELPSYDPPSTRTPVGRVEGDRQPVQSLEQSEEKNLDALFQGQVSDHDRRCNEARVALEVLHQGMPVYRMAEGKYGAAWSGDTYKGPRIYLNDADREEAIVAQLRKLALNCTDPLDEEQQEQASTEWYNEEKCKAARTYFEELVEPASRTPDQAIEEQQKIVDQYCLD